MPALRQRLAAIRWALRQPVKDIRDSRALSRSLAEARREVSQLTSVVQHLLERHHDALPLPPEVLRLHVGTETTMANFLAQGARSSRRVLEVFGETPEGLVLDWGCGSGRTLRWLWEYAGWRERYRGCDVDAEAIRWLEAQGIPSVRVCAPDPPLPYPDDEFAGVFAFSVLTHIHPERHRDWYLELQRVLRPGGRAYLTTHGSSLASLIPSAAQRQLRQSGFAYVENEGHYKDAAIASEEFTRHALEGIFDVESYRAGGYQNMDTVSVLKPA